MLSTFLTHAQPRASTRNLPFAIRGSSRGNSLVSQSFYYSSGWVQSLLERVKGEQQRENKDYKAGFPLGWVPAEHPPPGPCLTLVSLHLTPKNHLGAPAGAKREAAGPKLTPKECKSPHKNPPSPLPPPGDGAYRRWSPGSPW